MVDNVFNHSSGKSEISKNRMNNDNPVEIDVMSWIRISSVFTMLNEEPTVFSLLNVETLIFLPIECRTPNLPCCIRNPRSDLIECRAPRFPLSTMLNAEPLSSDHTECRTLQLQMYKSTCQPHMSIVFAMIYTTYFKFWRHIN